MELIGDPQPLFSWSIYNFHKDSYASINIRNRYIFFVISGSVLKQQAELINPIRSQQDYYVYIFWWDVPWFNSFLALIPQHLISQARTLVHSGSKCAKWSRCNVCTYVYMHVCCCWIQEGRVAKGELRLQQNCTLTMHYLEKKSVSKYFGTVSTAHWLFCVICFWATGPKKVTRLHYPAYC